MIYLTEKELKIVLDVLRQVANGCDVLIFGSRYNGRPKKFSDLDLAFVT